MSNQHTPTRQESGKALLHQSGDNSGSIISSALSSLNQRQRQNLTARASNEALRLEVKQREQYIDSLAGRHELQKHIETFSALDKSGHLTRHQLESDIKTGAGNMRIKSTAGPACFVATAVYGDPQHDDVVYLRSFRDTVLNRYLLGRWFIKLYWYVGPIMARYVVKSRFTRHSVRKFIETLVGGIQRFYTPVSLGNESHAQICR